MDLFGMTEVMPFYKTAFEDVFRQAVKACPFTKPLLRGVHQAEWPFLHRKATRIADKVELK
jgi:hypothetical protein